MYLRMYYSSIGLRLPLWEARSNLSRWVFWYCFTNSYCCCL